MTSQLRDTSASNPHFCCDCDSEFNSVSALTEHYDSVHVSNQAETESIHPLLCPYCLRNFTDDKNFTGHIALHEEEGPIYPCEICTKCFKSEKLLRFHRGETLQRCKHCHAFISQHRLENHLKKHIRSQLYECATCVLKVRHDELRLHEKIHHSNGSELTTCEECRKVFSSKRSHAAHMRRDHSDTYYAPLSEFTCDICLAVVLNSREEWEAHRQIHFAGSFPCPVCQKVFTEAAGLRNHQDVSLHHVDESLNQNQKRIVVTENCPFCGLTLTSRFEMKKHIRSDHEHLLAYQCHECDEISFGRQEYLTHMQFIHSCQSILCNFCKSEFTSLAALNVHIIAAHKQVQNIFVCEFCDVGFTTKEALLAHKLSHSTTPSQIEPVLAAPTEIIVPTPVDAGHLLVPPRQLGRTTAPQKIEIFNCSVCLQNFSTKGSLDTHIRSEHNTNSLAPPRTIPTRKSTGVTNKPNGVHNVLFRCKPCNLLFRGPDKLQEHKRLAHPPHSNFICTPCNMYFKTMPELKEHNFKVCTFKNSSVVYKPYVCSNCQKGFMLEASLLVHNCSTVVEPIARKFKYPEDGVVTFVLTVG